MEKVDQIEVSEGEGPIEVSPLKPLNPHSSYIGKPVRGLYPRIYQLLSPLPLTHTPREVNTSKYRLVDSQD